MSIKIEFDGPTPSGVLAITDLIGRGLADFSVKQLFEVYRPAVGAHQDLVAGYLVDCDVANVYAEYLQAMSYDGGGNWLTRQVPALTDDSIVFPFLSLGKAGRMINLEHARIEAKKWFLGKLTHSQQVLLELL